MLNSGKFGEMHIPNKPPYSFCGPFTKMHQRLSEGQAGINELDKFCRQHDIFYSLVDDVKFRHVFDKDLENNAKKIMYDPNAKLKERVDAGLVTVVMNMKRKLGMGN